MNWRLWTWRDILGVSVAAVLVAGMVYYAAFVPHVKDNWGLGPDWSCSNPGKGDPVCTKKTLDVK